MRIVYLNQSAMKPKQKALSETEDAVRWMELSCRRKLYKANKSKLNSIGISEDQFFEEMR